MKVNYALLILGALVLVQLSHAAPTQTQSDDAEISFRSFYEEESEEEKHIKNVTVRHRIYELRREHLIELLIVTLKEAKNYLKEVVKELKTRESQYPLLSGHISRLTNFIDDMETLRNKPSRDHNKYLLNYFEEYMDIYKTYETSEIAKPSDEVNMIEKLLDFTEWNFLMLGFSFGYIGVCINVTKEVKTYIDSLTEEQRVQERELIEWYNKENNVVAD